jgi:hypothetical protein
MTIEKTIEVPANRRITIDVPPQTPTGAYIIIQFPIREEAQIDNRIPLEAKGQTNNEAFRNALRRANGAWKDNPWINHIEDVNAMRDEWETASSPKGEISSAHRN